MYLLFLFAVFSLVVNNVHCNCNILILSEKQSFYDEKFSNGVRNYSDSNKHHVSNLTFAYERLFSIKNLNIIPLKI